MIDTPATRATPSDAPEPPSRRARGPRLKTVDDVKAELARLYREAKAGTRDVAAASKLANMLAIMGRMIEGADFEARIAALERAARKDPP